MGNGSGRLCFSDIAEKYGVAPKQITRDQEQIMKIVRKRAEELKKEQQEWLMFIFQIAY